MRWAWLPVLIWACALFPVFYNCGRSAESREWTETARRCVDVARRAQKLGSICIDVLASHQHSENERCFCFSPSDGGTF